MSEKKNYNMKKTLKLSLEEARKIYKTACPEIKLLLENNFTKQELDKTLNRITLDDMNIYINNKLAGALHTTEKGGEQHNGCAVSGHKASMYLCYLNSGTWYTEKGEPISGYLYFKPQDQE